MAGKILNVAGITNELQGASVFFGKPTPLPSSPSEPESRDETGSQAPTEPKTGQVSPISTVPDKEPEPTPEKPPKNIPQPVLPQPALVNKEPVIPAERTTPPDTSQVALDTEPNASLHARKQASMLASNHDSVLAKVKETIRQIGKEVSYTRLTLEEKKRIVDVLYEFRSNGIKISENELFRIAINVLLEDFTQFKDKSLLQRVLRP